LTQALKIATPSDDVHQWSQPESALAPIRMAKSRFNATLRDGQAVGFPFDTFRSEAIHRVRKRGCAVSGDDANTEGVKDKLQIQLR